MRMVDLIERTRDGAALGDEQVRWLVDQVVAASVPDYQIAAWLMAVTCRGLSEDETVVLTDAMARSGTVLDLSDLPGPVVDKHSTGGVGDKTSLVVGPLAAATGLTVAKMSGRGLGHTGGTLDKLESIPGLTVNLDAARFKRQAGAIRLVIAGQTADLAPADKTLYALRDVTGTVPSLPLIAASIMSKKIAAGAAAIVLDVKVGAGAFLNTESAARALAALMVRLGAGAGRRVVAVLTAMDEPLGCAVGNALELREAIETLQGRGPADLAEVARVLTGHLHVAAGRADTADAVSARLQDAVTSGRALERLAAMIEAQGGDPAVVADPDRLPSAPALAPVRAPRGGVVRAVDALAIGRAAAGLGAGRVRKGDPVDPAVGIVLSAKSGDPVRAGERLATVHARRASEAEAVAGHLSAAWTIGDGAPAARPIILGAIADG